MGVGQRLPTLPEVAEVVQKQRDPVTGAHEWRRAAESALSGRREHECMVEHEVYPPDRASTSIGRPKGGATIKGGEARGEDTGPSS
jgi:hypothetical protein